LTCADAGRSDFLSPVAPAIPDELYAKGLVPVSDDDTRPLFHPDRQVVVLSLLADVQQTAFRHRRKRYLFLPLPQWQERWSESQRAWVADHFNVEPVIDLEVAAMHWRLILAEIQRRSRAIVFLCNVFRHIQGPPAYRYFGTPVSLGERIRRFNLLAAELSQETGICIIDLDRALAARGARALQTDYRLTSEPAATVGAEVLVSTLLRAGLDDFLTPEDQAKALANLETRLAVRDWCSSQMYRLQVLSLFQLMQSLKSKWRGDAAGAREFGEQLLGWGDKFQFAAGEAVLSVNRQFLTALRELGAAHVDAATAMTTGDSAAQQQALARIAKGQQQLQVFWTAFDDFNERSAQLSE
jgi:hypothetical protein